MYQYRMAKAEDLKRIAEIEMRSRKDATLPCPDERQADFENRRRWWTSYFNRSEGLENLDAHRVIFVAMIKLNVVGYIAGHLTSQPDPRGEIQSMHILEPQRGKGVEVNLLRKLGWWFKRQGIASVCVDVTEHNPYKEFYAQHGATAVSDSVYQWDDIGIILDKP